MSYYRLQARAPEPKTKKAAPRFAPPCVRNPLWQGLSAALPIMSLYQIHYSKFLKEPAAKGEEINNVETEIGVECGLVGLVALAVGVIPIDIPVGTAGIE